MDKTEDGNPVICRNTAVAYIVFPGDARRRYANMANELSVSRQREAIERKAKDMGWEIVHEFVLPKKANHIESPEFHEVVDCVARNGVRNVIIYSVQPLRNYVKSALIEATLMRVGARIVSIHDTDDYPAQVQGILRAIRSFNVLARREAQLEGARRRQRAAEAA